MTTQDLHQTAINAIHVQTLGSTALIITGSQDGHVKIWQISGEGKFECAASGMATAAVHSVALINEMYLGFFVFLILIFPSVYLLDVLEDYLKHLLLTIPKNLLDKKNSKFNQHLQMQLA